MSSDFAFPPKSYAIGGEWSKLADSLIGSRSLVATARNVNALNGMKLASSMRGPIAAISGLAAAKQLNALANVSFAPAWLLLRQQINKSLLWQQPNFLFASAAAWEAIVRVADALPAEIVIDEPVADSDDGRRLSQLADILDVLHFVIQTVFWIMFLSGREPPRGLESDVEEALVIAAVILLIRRVRR